MSESLKVLILNASLKHGPEASNTEEVALMVADEIKQHAAAEHEVIRLSDLNILVGLKSNMGPGDEWPQVAEKIKAADTGRLNHI